MRDEVPVTANILERSEVVLAICSIVVVDLVLIRSVAVAIAISALVETKLVPVANKKLAEPVLMVTLEMEVVAKVACPEMVVVVNVLAPCTDKVPILVVEAKVLSLDVSLDIVVVASVVVAAVKVEVALIDPETRDDPVALSKKSEEILADTTFNILEKKLVDVAADPEALVKDIVLIVVDDTVRSEIVVVAKTV